MLTTPSDDRLVPWTRPFKLTHWSVLDLCRSWKHMNKVWWKEDRAREVGTMQLDDRAREFGTMPLTLPAPAPHSIGGELCPYAHNELPTTSGDPPCPQRCAHFLHEIAALKSDNMELSIAMSSLTSLVLELRDEVDTLRRWNMQDIREVVQESFSKSQPRFEIYQTITGRPSSKPLLVVVLWNC